MTSANPSLVRRRTRKQAPKKVSKVAKKPDSAVKGISDLSGRAKLVKGRTDYREDIVFRDKLVGFIMAGNTFENACALMRIHRATYYRWMAEGESAEAGTIAHSFFLDVEQAKAQAEHRNSMRVQKGVGNWQSSSWFLERRNHKKWGRKDVIKVANEEVGQPLLVGVVSEDTMSDSETMAALKAILTREGEL